jgi:flagellin
MREVSVQAANDTNNSQDRANLQSEMDAMVTEIDRIASTTTWAGENLMKSSSGSNFSFQVGAATGVENQITVTIDGMGSKSLGVAASSGVEVTNAAIAQVAYDALVADKVAKDALAVTAGVTHDNATKAVPALEAVAAASARLTSDGATDQKKAAGLRDILVGLDKAAAAGVASSAMPDRSVAGMDTLAASLQTIITKHITVTSEQNAAQTALNGFTSAIADFKATTTNADALTKFNALDAKYQAIMDVTVGNTVTAGTNPQVTTTTHGGSKIGNMTLTAARTGGAAVTATSFEAADGTNVLETLAAAITHVQNASDQGITGDVTTAKAAVTTTKAALVAAEDAAATSQANLNASNDPADLKGVNLSVNTGAGALASIITIDSAIKTVNIQRSELGAVSNRLNHTVNNLTNISSNLSAAKGGIEDADFALETTNLAKNQILQQASTAMLAQANASKQNVLSLLQG